MGREAHDDRVARVRCKQVTTRSRSVLLQVALSSAFALALFLLAACSSSARTQPTATIVHATATATPLPAPTSLIVVRLSGFVEQNRVAPFQMTAQDTAKVLQLYQAARTLPPVPPRISCALSRAIGYELSFMHDNTVVLQVLLIFGCPTAEVSGLPGCRAWPPDFTAQIASTLGVPMTTLQPPPPNDLVNTASPSGPFAQAAPTEPILISAKCSY